MSPAIASSLGIVAYLGLFFGVGLLFIFANLFIGRFLRPHDPHPEKLEIYECGEPTIGSSFVQFDLRFYVVALLFIIFDVEVAFFFPWAVIYGKSAKMMDSRRPAAALVEIENDSLVLSTDARNLYREMGVRNPQVPTAIPASLKSTITASAAEKSGEAPLTQETAAAVIREGSRQLLWITIVDIFAFFGVLLVGFAYVWRRGDLDWVRAMSKEKAAANESTSGGPERMQESPVLSA